MTDQSLELTRRALLARGAAVGGGLALAGGMLPALAEAATKPKRGGSFRLGVTGGSAKDLIDGQNIVTKPDQARLVAGFETLLAYDMNYKLYNNLAEEFSAKRADVWTIRVRDGIEFHNGKTLSADDVIYSIKRLINPKLKLFGGSALSSVDPARIKKLDKRTVRLTLKQKDSTIPDAFGQYIAGMVPVGYQPYPAKQVGTGPYVLKSFTPGQQSVHTRFANYWRTGQPYFDQVTVTDFADDTARVNALLGGQIDAMTDLPFAQVAIIKGNSKMRVLESEGGGWLPLCMAVDQAPFDDVRVRQAFRLIADRQQIVDQALSGHGRVANDLYGIFDPAYNHALPQRTQDLDKAKSLLKAAGKDGATFELNTTDGGTGMVESAQVFAQQAKGAGITVNVNKLDGNTFYGSQYLKWTFSSDFWGTRLYLSQVAAGSLPKSPYNETHWKDPKFISLYKKALSQVDLKDRKVTIGEMQKMEYDTGGYLIPFFNNLLDAYSSKVQGFGPDKGTLNLNGFGNGYRTIWFG